MFALQRFSGIVTFIFIFMHLWQTTIQKYFGKAVDFELMHKTLENPIWVIVYIVCVLCVPFLKWFMVILCNMGFLQSKQSQRVFTWISLIVFLVLGYIEYLQFSHLYKTQLVIIYSTLNFR